VDLKEKVDQALRRYLRPDLVELADDDGISGFVVSPQFRGMSALDRQTLIYNALRDSSVKLSGPELRRVLAIAALTPAEYASVSHRS
jgi:stress-induced morphogen